MLSTCFVLQVSSPPTGIPKRRLLHAKEQTSCSANIAGVAKHTPSPPPHAADVLLHSTIRPTFEDDVLHSLHFTELEKLKDFESDFSAFLRWFRSSHLGFAASMRWLGSVSKFEHRVLVGGNHDYILEKLGPERAQMLCEDFGVKYLHTEAAPLSLSFPSGRKVKIWGSGVSFFAALGKDRAVISGNIAYQLDTATEEDKFVKETAHVKPGSVNVLITHGPPAGALYGKGDQPKWINDLLKRVKPQVYLCGHAHNPEKVKLEQKVADVEGTLGAHIASTSVWNAYMGLPFICDLPEWK
ncbi:unnamed protein product [Durusdinium trenchii]|uniref:Calcineurin-like phosphoesterase domain-containing protein n=1 Tax=Durusdinium trenchii TaxID=1381693 RepID=A0ABP0QHY3_9DINO